MSEIPHPSPERIEAPRPEPTEKTKERPRIPRSLQETLEAAADVATERLLTKLDSPEGLRTDFKTYRAELVAVLGEMEARLPKGHVLRGTTKLIVENYLTPEERGAELIRSFLERAHELVKNPDRRLAVGAKEFDLATKTLRSSVAFGIDLAKTQPEKIPKFVEELKRFGGMGELFSKFPDLATVLCDVLPNVGQHADKEAVLKAYDVFVGNVRQDAVRLLEGSVRDDAERTGVALKFANESAKFLGAVISEKTVRGGIDGISKLQAVGANPLAEKLLAIVRNPGLSDADRLLLAKKGVEGMELFTENPPDEAKLERYVNQILVLVAKLKPKLPKGAVDDFVGTLLSGTPTKPGERKELDAWELVKLIGENASNLVTHREKIQRAVAEYAKGNLDPLKEVVMFLLEGDVLKENIRLAEGNFIRRIKGIVDLKISTFATELQKRLGTSLKTDTVRLREVLPKHGDPFVDAVTERFVRSASESLFGANRPKTVTKETLFENARRSVEETLAALPGSSVRIGNVNVPKTALLETVRSEPFKDWLLEGFSAAASGAKGEGAMKKAVDVVTAVMKNPFSNPYLSAERQERAVESAVNLFYSLPSSELGAIVSEGMSATGIGEFLKRSDGSAILETSDVRALIDVLRDDRGDGKGPVLSRETAKTLLKDCFGPPPNFGRAVSEFLRNLSKDDVSAVVEKLERSGTLGKLAELRNVGAKGAELDVRKAGSLVDFILSAESKTDAASRKILFERFGIDPSGAETALALIRALGGERTKALLNLHAETVAKAASGGTEWLRSNPEAVAALVTDVAYAVDEPELRTRFLPVVRREFPALEGLLRTDVLGIPLEERLIALRNAVPREDLRRFMVENAAELAGLGESFDTERALVLGGKFFLSVPEESLAILGTPTETERPSRSVGEKLPQIRKAVAEFGGETTSLTDGRSVSRLNALLSKAADAVDGTISEADSRVLAEEGFELLSRIVSALGDDWSLPKGGAENPLSVRMKSAFVRENPGFVVSQAIPYLFGRHTEEIVRRFFADPTNKPGFVAAMAPIIQNPKGSGA